MSTAKRGKVRVERGRYRLDGQFHFPYPNDPIRNEDGVLMCITNPRDLTRGLVIPISTPSSLRMGSLG